MVDAVATIEFVADRSASRVLDDDMVRCREMEAALTINISFVLSPTKLMFPVGLLKNVLSFNAAAV